MGESQWPSPRITEKTFRFGPGTELQESDGQPDDEVTEAEASIQSPLNGGLFAGKWASYAAAPDLPHDQREEDGGALVYESGPLAEDLEILGAPSVTLTLASNEPVAMVAVRLSDVAPDGKATRVTYGLLNLNHRRGDDRPELLIPGEFFETDVPLNHIAQVFPAGHRLRISISTSYWALTWPPPIAITLIEPAHHNWLVHRDLAEDLSILEVIKDNGCYRIEEIDLEVTSRNWDLAFPRNFI